MMLYGGNPFRFAILKDKNYKLIADKSHNDFWQSKENGSNVIFSAEAKDLIEHMVAYKQEDRFTMD